MNKTVPSVHNALPVLDGMGVLHGPDGTTDLTELALKVLKKHEATENEYCPPSVPLSRNETRGTHGTERTFRTKRTLGTDGTVVTDLDRKEIMRTMVDWNERAAMMTCGDLTVEQAETLAWHDLNLDEVFFGIRRSH